MKMTFTLAEVPPFYQGYIRNVLDADLLTIMQTSGDDFLALCKDLTESQAMYRYAPGKWSIKDLILHLVDSERVFAYRALSFARNDQAELPGFDQDTYVEAARADRLPLEDLIASFQNARQSSIDLFAALTEAELRRVGVSNGVQMSVEMIGFVISGHTRHHHHIITKKYL